MDKLFMDTGDGKLVLGVEGFKLKGKAKYVFAMLELLATTEVLSDDEVYWWAKRAEILANDRDSQFCPEASLRFN